MYSLLYIDISGKLNYSFEKEIISRVKNIYPTVTTYDIDQNSEAFTIDAALRLLKESERCIVFVESQADYATKILPFAELIIQHPQNFLVFLQGENQWLEKICMGIHEHYLKKNLDMTQQVLLAQSFLSSVN